MGESSDYNIYVYGGDVYVNCDGDGLDSNGGLYLYGGTLSVLSMKGGGDNSPLDADGEVIIDGATIFAAGSAGMERMRQGSGNGSQAVYTSNNQLQAGTVVNIMQGNTLLFSEKLVKNVNYCIFSSPSLTSSASISTSSQITPCSSNAWEHSWDNGVIVTEASETKEGLMVYTCSACGAKEYKTIPKTAAEDTGSITEPVNDPEPEAPSQTDTALVITPDAAEIATGKTLQLTAFSDPSGANVSGLIWSSSDESVAAVDNNGTVTALTYGTAVITAESADGSLKASAVIQTRYYDVAGSPSSSASDYQYYYNAVYWAADSGITKGYGNIYFAPESECTRREMLIFLWRMAGKPVSEDYANPNEVFSDMSNYAPYTDTYRAVSWGISEGIVKGYTDGTFRPDMQVTRKDTLIMLYRMAGKPDVSGQIEYTDVISENYSESSDTYKAILWADQNNITNGYSDGTFRPLDSCLREHIITFLYRYAMMIYK